MNAAQRRRHFERQAKYRVEVLEDLCRYLTKAQEPLIIAGLRAHVAGEKVMGKTLDRFFERMAAMYDVAVVRLGDARNVSYCRCGFPSPDPDEADFRHDDSCPRNGRLRIVDGGAA